MRWSLERAPRRLAVTLAVLVALLVIIRLVLDPIAAHYVRKTLDCGEGFRAAFAGVHVTIVPPAVNIRRFKVIEWPKGKWENPLYYMENVHAGIHWREVLRGHLVADVKLQRPKILLIARQEKTKGKKAKTIGEQLEEMSPLRVDRLEVDHGELLIARGTGGRAPELWIHGADLVAENMATRKALMEGEYSQIKGSARVQRSGKLNLAVGMDPFAKELYAFTADRTDLRAESGTIDMFVDLRARGGVLSGGVKPVLKNVEVSSASKNLGDRLKGALADAALDIVSDKSEGQDRVTTVIPLKGKVNAPKAQVLPTVLGAIRNAFVEGLAGGFAGLPPPTAEKKEGFIKQTWKALKKGEGQPEAQPESSRAGRRGKR